MKKGRRKDRVSRARNLSFRFFTENGSWKGGDVGCRALVLAFFTSEGKGMERYSLSQRAQPA